MGLALFCPARATCCTDKMKFGTGSGHVFTFIGAEMWEHNPKTVKIWNFGHKFAPKG